MADALLGIVVEEAIKAVVWFPFIYLALRLNR